MWTRAQLKEKAKVDLARSYWGLVITSIGAAFISAASSGGGGGGGNSYNNSSSNELERGLKSLDPGLLIGIIISILAILSVVIIISIAITIFIKNPILVGTKRYFIEATYGAVTVNDIKVLVNAFKKGIYMNVVKTEFLRALYKWLWGLLFVIPGIIKGYEYRMIPYILAENPNVQTKDAFQLSKEMMDGQKWDTFVLDLSFIGWVILSVFTCGILSIFYVSPYQNMTNAQLYETLKHRSSINYYDNTLISKFGNPGAYQATNSQNGDAMNPNMYGQNDYYQPYDYGNDIQQNNGNNVNENNPYLDQNNNSNNY